MDLFVYWVVGVLSLILTFAAIILICKSHKNAKEWEQESFTKFRESELSHTVIQGINGSRPDVQQPRASKLLAFQKQPSCDVSGHEFKIGTQLKGSIRDSEILGVQKSMERRESVETSLSNRFFAGLFQESLAEQVKGQGALRSQGSSKQVSMRFGSWRGLNQSMVDTPSK